VLPTTILSPAFSALFPFYFGLSTCSLLSPEFCILSRSQKRYIEDFCLIRGGWRVYNDEVHQPV